jgi:uncharacterized membrane protein YtjA (UPF0391 family)
VSGGEKGMKWQRHPARHPFCLLFQPSSFNKKRRQPMIGWALTFLVIAIIAAILGFSGVAGSAAWAAQVCVVVFLILFVISFISGRRTPVA